ncbi:unnamed protein product, partial [Effrenium voratum]
DVTWSAKGMPFFISGSDKLRISTEDAYREGVDVETQNAMMAARSADTTSYSPGERLIRARSSRHKHSSTSRSFSGGSDSQGEARASGDSSSPRREEITPLPA